MSQQNEGDEVVAKTNPVILSGSINPGEGMSMDLSAAANNLPEGHVLHWHTELAPVVEAPAAGEQADETNDQKQAGDNEQE